MAALLQCVRSHEKRHRDGDDHPAIALPFVDCGDGTFLGPSSIQGR